MMRGNVLAHPQFYFLPQQRTKNVTTARPNFVWSNVERKIVLIDYCVGYKYVFSRGNRAIKRSKRPEPKGIGSIFPIAFVLVKTILTLVPSMWKKNIRDAWCVLTGFAIKINGRISARSYYVEKKWSLHRSTKHTYKHNQGDKNFWNISRAAVFLLPSFVIFHWMKTKVKAKMVDIRGKEWERRCLAWVDVRKGETVWKV